MASFSDDDVHAQIAACKELFTKHFGGQCSHVVSAPGRVNLIGEHTDYNEGFVMPFCIQRCTVLAARKIPGTRCRVVSVNEGAGTVMEFDGDASLAPCADWTNYMRGVVAQYLPSLPGGSCAFEAAVLSTVPLGGGLSSSASLEVATATLLESLYGLQVDPKEKALRCQKCEHTFCDTPCGIMDQMISACGRPGAALLIDCRPPFATEQVPLDDPDLVLLVANSNVKHRLSGSEYPDRVRQCKEACAAMRAKGHTQVNFLRDATPAMLQSCTDSLSAEVIKRASHGISEDQRTIEAKEALKAQDYVRVGKLMHQSHVSLRDSYEVSCPELDVLVEIAMGVEGVYGSRMTGGGFGGCTITLLKKAAVPALLKAIGVQYPQRCGLTKVATCFATTAAEGARVRQAPLSAASRAAWALAGALAVGGLAMLAARRK